MKREFILSILVAVQLFVGLFNQLIVLRFVGIGNDTDAYIASQTIPFILVAIMYAALQGVWLPLLTKVSISKPQFLHYKSIAMGQAFILAVASVFTLCLSIQLWLPSIFVGFSDQQLSQTIDLSFIIFFAALFQILSIQLTVILRSEKRFYVAESTALCGGLLALALIVVAVPRWGIYAAAYIFLLRSILVFIFQMYVTKFPRISIKNGFSEKETWVLMKPILSGAVVYKTMPAVDRYWASQLTAGGLTLLNMAMLIAQSIATILDRAFCTPLVSEFGHYVREEKYHMLQGRYRWGVFRITLIILILGLLLYVARPFIEWMAKSFLLFGAADASLLWLLSLLLLGYVHVAASGSIPVAVFYALKDTKTPLFIGIVSFIAGVLAKVVGFMQFGLEGLVIATSAYYILTLFLMCTVLEWKIKRYVS